MFAEFSGVRGPPVDCGFIPQPPAAVLLRIAGGFQLGSCGWVCAGCEAMVENFGAVVALPTYFVTTNC